MAETLKHIDSAQTHLRDHSLIVGYPPQSGLDDTQAEQLTFPRSHVSLALEEEATLLINLPEAELRVKPVVPETQKE